ncbi:hypothetical protein GW17_00025715 [Ensete ventricosum]|uniref:Uncharacterized protein n=1 Tax=Ensete ventricosum TaxID=4639 RepID=A0A427AZK9_ENSVE|nr:hypothetical protein B296_00021512 [Ensete ventricosum]RWW10727.1 hypothetical protein GW17_00025715 [Ensete ventricosum]
MTAGLAEKVPLNLNRIMPAKGACNLFLFCFCVHAQGILRQVFSWLIPHEPILQLRSSLMWWAVT